LLNRRKVGRVSGQKPQLTAVLKDELGRTRNALVIEGDEVLFCGVQLTRRVCGETDAWINSCALRKRILSVSYAASVLALAAFFVRLAALDGLVLPAESEPRPASVLVS
jgi:hypothetical protein